MPNYEDHLLDQKRRPKATYKCTGPCGRRRPPFQMEMRAGKLICTKCLQDVGRGVVALLESLAAPDLSWSGPAGDTLRARRLHAIAEYEWAVAAHSPLSAANRQQWAEYLRAWHRMTVDAATPADFVEPEPPALEYGD